MGLTTLDQPDSAQVAGSLLADFEALLNPIQRKHVFKRKIGADHEQLRVGLINHSTRDRELHLAGGTEIVVRQRQETTHLILHHPMDFRNPSDQ